MGDPALYEGEEERAEHLRVCIHLFLCGSTMTSYLNFLRIVSPVMTDYNLEL